MLYALAASWRWATFTALARAQPPTRCPCARWSTSLVDMDAKQRALICRRQRRRTPPLSVPRRSRCSSAARSGVLRRRSPTSASRRASTTGAGIRDGCHCRPSAIHHRRARQPQQRGFNGARVPGLPVCRLALPHHDDDRRPSLFLALTSTSPTTASTLTRHRPADPRSRRAARRASRGRTPPRRLLTGLRAPAAGQPSTA